MVIIGKWSFEILLCMRKRHFNYFQDIFGFTNVIQTLEFERGKPFF